MRRLWCFVGLSMIGLGCAHAPKPEAPAAAALSVPIQAAKPQPKVETVLAPIDPAAELAAALGGSTVFFDFDSDRLRPEGMDALQRAATVLRKYSSLAVKIEGNTDERGTEEYNLLLGHRRAEAASKYLNALGVPPQQLFTISYGALKPLDSRHSEDAWAQNRRDTLRASK